MWSLLVAPTPYLLYMTEDLLELCMTGTLPTVSLCLAWMVLIINPIDLKLLISILSIRCEPFDTYPRTYDLLHAAGLFSVERKR